MHTTFHAFPTISRSTNFCIFFFTKHNLSLTRSLRQSRWHGLEFTRFPARYYYYYKQDTVRFPRVFFGYVPAPYLSHPVDPSSCFPDYCPYFLDGGDTWTPNKREGCLVGGINAMLQGVSDGHSAHNWIECTSYDGSGRTDMYPSFFILMKGDHACCVRSSLQTPHDKCP